MARSRNIKPGFFMNDELAEIEPLGRILFAGLWCIADREGRLKDRPKRIKAEVLPYDDCNMDELLNQLAARDFIIRYEIDGKRYIQITNFKKHQNPHKNEAPSVIPAPEEAQYKHSTSTVQVQEKHNTNPADSLNMIPDSLNMIPDHYNQKEDGAIQFNPDQIERACDDVTEPAESKKKDSKPKSQGKKKPKFSEEGREITKYLQEKLKNAGVDHFPRDWLLKNYATADRLLKTIPKPELEKCIAWAMDDPFWKNTINDLLSIEKAYMQFKRKGVKANGPRSPGIPGQGRRELYSEEDRENAAAWEW